MSLSLRHGPPRRLYLAFYPKSADVAGSATHAALLLVSHSPNGDTIDKQQVITNRAAFVPFSLGPQNCAGKNVAMVEMRAVLCALLQKFDLHSAKNYNLDDWEKGLIDVYLTLRGPLPAVLTPRQTT